MAVRFRRARAQGRDPDGPRRAPGRFRVPLVVAALGAQALVVTAVVAGGGWLDQNPVKVAVTSGHLELAASTEAVLERNDGQFDEAVDFVARGADATVALSDGELVYHTGDGTAGHVIRMAVVGAAPDPTPEARFLAGTTTRYFLGDDPDRWVTDVQAAAVVDYPRVLPGVDIRYLGTDGALRYDLLLEPGVDPAVARLRFDGAEAVTVTADGSLVAAVSAGTDLVFSAPVVHQTTPEGQVVAVDSAYAVDPDGTVGFTLGPHDPSLPLVIDPTLQLGTYVGSSGDDQVWGVAVDGTGAMYLAGESLSTDVTGTPGAYDPTHNGGGDAVVIKLDPSGAGVSWTTFIGGSGADEALDVKLAADGDVVVVANTTSADFPTTGADYDTTHNGGWDAAVFELSANGATLRASTYFGGSADEGVSGLDLGPTGDIVIAGTTDSTGSIASSGAYDTTKFGSTGFDDGFVAAFSPDLATRRWATYVGGFGNESTGGIDVDTTGDVWATVNTSAELQTTAGAYDTTYNGGTDGYLARFSSTGAFEYGTFLGGAADDRLWRVAARSSTEVYLAGGVSSGYPTTPGAHDTSHNGGLDQVLSILDLSLSGSGQLRYSSFLGGSGNDVAYGLAVDAHGRAYLAGETDSASGVATVGAPDPSHNGAVDGLLAVMDPTAPSLPLASYIGGAGNDVAASVVVSDTGEVLVVGYTSGGLATTAGALDTTANGGADGFVHRYGALDPPNVVTVNSGGDGADNTIGDHVCSTGATIANGEAACTLRAAIAEANASATIDTIHFDIPTADGGHSGGVWTLVPATALPAVTGPVTVDGTTQTGTVVNTTPFPNDTNGSLTIRLSGSSLPSGTDGLQLVTGSSGSTIRGLALTGFDGGNARAIAIAGSSGNVIAGNHIGVTPAGTAAAGNDIGIELSGTSTGNRIGGTAAADRNLITANTYAGVVVNGSTVTSTTVQGNEIGLLNAGVGVTAGSYGVVAFSGASDVRIGGTAPGAGNRITGHGVGVSIDANTTDARGWVVGNAIWANVGIGIDLLNNGITANDAGDGDTGPNDLLNHPVLTSATVTAGQATVSYTLDAPAGNYRVELFDNDVGDPSGHGEGQTLLDADLINHPGGAATYSHTVPATMGDVLTATATTDTGGGTFGVTSEFSAAVTALEPVVLDRIQKGVTTLANGATSVTATIDAVDTTRSFLIFSLRGDDTNPVNLAVTGELTDATTVTFQRHGTTGAVVLDWSVVSFSSGVLVQRGSTITAPAATVTTIPITAVDTTRSFPLISHRMTGVTFSANDFLRSSLDATSLTLTQASPAGVSDLVVKWQVITYSAASVQAGTVAFSSVDASKTATLAPFDTGQAWLVYTTSTWEGDANNIGQKLVRGRVTDATTLTFDRSSTGQNMTVSYFLVEFTDTTTVQRGSAQFTGSDTTRTATITAVDPARAIAVGGAMGYGGRSAYTADDNPGTGWFTARLTTATKIRTERAVTGSTTADLGWFVVHWPGAATTTVSVNSTDDEPDLWPGDGYCDTGQANDTGQVECTLRAAIEEADANAALDTVAFALPTADGGYDGGGGFWTISPDSTLELTSAITVDATTQPGYGATPVILLLGTGAAGGADGFTVTGDDVTLRGFAIADFPAAGIYVAGTADGTVIESNHIGTDTTGTTALPHAFEGVYADGATNLRIGGPGAGNVISGNASAGIGIDNATGVAIGANRVGTTPDGATMLANAEAGIMVTGSSGVTIGGTTVGDANIIAGNTLAGVAVTGASDDVAVIGNAIHDNGGLGIDLGLNGVTANDGNDIDTGPNGRLNFPVLTGAVSDGGLTTLTWTLDVPAGSYRMELFTNAGGADPTGYGEGRSLVGSVTVASSGVGPESHSATVSAAPGDVVTATVTEIVGPNGHGATSEFSAAESVVITTGDTAIDSSGRRSDLTAAGGLSLAAPGNGVAGSGIDLTGGSQRLVGPATDVTSGALTLSAWFRRDTTTTDPRVVAKTSAGGTAVYELLVDDGTQELVGRLRVGGTTVELRAGTITSGAWHFAALTWDGATAVLHLDGQPVDSAGAIGALATDLAAPLVVGNRATADRGLDGSVDQVQLGHTVRPAAWLATVEANLRQPSAFVSLGAPQTESPGAWTTTSAGARTGTSALAAPDTAAPGAGAWATATGIDEPGLEFESWWRVSDLAGLEAAAGTRAGGAPVTQFETALTASGFDLGTLLGADRSTVSAPAVAMSPLTWTRVTIRTDETGASTVLVNGVAIHGPAGHSGGPPSGSAGLRVGQLATGQSWYVDDVQLRRLVSDEPTTAVGPLDRN